MDKKGLVKDIIIVVLALAVTGLAYIGWSKGFLNFGSKKESSVPAQQIQDETAGWKTYTNEKYGFEIKYPPNYNVSNLRDGIVGKSLESKYSFIDFSDLQKPYGPVNKSIIINGIEGMESKILGNMDGGIDYGVSFKSQKTQNGYLGVGFLTNAKGYESKIEEFKEILSTFKFIK